MYPIEFLQKIQNLGIKIPTDFRFFSGVVSLMSLNFAPKLNLKIKVFYYQENNLDFRAFKNVWFQLRNSFSILGPFSLKV